MTTATQEKPADKKPATEGKVPEQKTPRKSADPIIPIGVKVEAQVIDPDTARDWLEHNTSNRKLRKSHVTTLSRDMSEDRWPFTGDTVKFREDGVLLDGQHRLAAIAASGRSQALLVVRGLPKSSQMAMDIGARRTAADALRLRGETGDTKNMTAIARGLLMYDTGNVPTNTQTVQYVEANEEILHEAAEISEMIRRAGRLTGGAFYGIAFAILSRVDHDNARQFFEHLASGAELEADDPILVLLRTLAKGLPYGFGRAGWHLRNNLAYVFTAWNAWRDGKKLTSLRVRKGKLPEPH